MELIIVTGMPGAGKSEIAQIFRDAGVPVIVMGDIVRKEAKRRGLKATPENTRHIMLELRERDGPGAIASRCIEDLRSHSANLLVIEGCRSISEVDVFDDFADRVTIIGVHSSPRARFERLQSRHREDAPTTWSVFHERDMREISVGLGGVIALSDIMLVNEGSLDSFRREARLIVQRLNRG
ncbi:MAG: AAA family ATPase [Candidatus Thorarchaeota archaeon]